MKNEKKRPWTKDKLFKKVTAEVIRELPPPLRKALGTVQIVVQARPSQDHLSRSRLKQGDDLFGLFDGLSLKDWPIGQDRYQPDRVILFEENLKRYFPKKEALRRQIRITLIHELGHYFGFSEKELRDRGWA